MIPQLYTSTSRRKKRPDSSHNSTHSRNSREIKRESDDVNECVLPDLPALEWVVCVYIHIGGVGEGL